MGRLFTRRALVETGSVAVGTIIGLIISSHLFDVTDGVIRIAIGMVMGFWLGRFGRELT